MRLFGAIAVSLLASAAFSAVLVEAAPVVREFSRSVSSDVETQISNVTFWNSDCIPRQFTLTIQKGPGNGTVSIRDGLNQVVENPKFGAAGRCAGQKVMGKQIVYRSKPGFKGKDVLTYEVVSDNGEKGIATVNIEVK